MSRSLSLSRDLTRRDGNEDDVLMVLIDTVSPDFGFVPLHGGPYAGKAEGLAAV